MNYAKHTIAGILTVSIISSTAAKQFFDCRASRRISMLLVKNNTVSTYTFPEYRDYDFSDDPENETASPLDTAQNDTNKIDSNTGTSAEVTENQQKDKGIEIVNEAKKYLGVKYVYGGSSPKGFDCSGLVQYVCKKQGISVSRTSAEQFKNGRSVQKSELMPGDLLFFKKNGKIHHVGIYVGDNKMIHAPRTGDVVKYSPINTAYRNKEYAGARRIY